MKLAGKLDSANSVEGTIDDPKQLYIAVMAELNQGIMAKRGTEYFQSLWSLVAPTGNIYRYNGLLAERRKHCEDLRKQAMEVADSYSYLLGGSMTSPGERLGMLTKALEKTQVRGSFSKQTEMLEAAPPLTTGFHPLQEYMDEVRRFGPFLEPVDAKARNHHRKAVCIAFFIFGIQILAPGLVFANRWYMDTNFLRDPHTLYARLTFAEAMCLGRTPLEKWTTVMGVCFITVLIFVVRLYVAEENENATKSSRLPTDTFWLTVGIVANMWCCILTVLALPVLFWSEDTPTSIVLDSMTLLFVFKIDDLSEILGSFLNMTDSEFQRVAAWNAALLAQCPVRVRDLINFEAKSVEELWSIEFDSTGHLLTTAQPGNPSSHVCETRLMPLASSERTGLLRQQTVRDGSQLVVASARLQYHRSQEHREVLPTVLSTFLQNLWIILGWLLSVLQFVIPPMWFVVSKPCYIAK